MIVSSPVTNIRLISIPNSFPNSEKAPTTIATSCTSAMIAAIA